jgi:hypothetical protein
MSGCWLSAEVFCRVLQERSRFQRINNRKAYAYAVEGHMPTNDERAERGREILEMYAVQFGDPYDPSANLTDVLTDLMHVAVREPDLRLEFQASLRMAEYHFEAEIEESLDV